MSVSATHSKDRRYLELAQCLTRLSRAMGQTADLCEHLKVNLDAMKSLAANHAAQYAPFASRLTALHPHP